MNNAPNDGDGMVDVRNQYDADGNRVAQVTGGQETRFLVDTNRRYAEVLAEYPPGGAVAVSYVHGLDLISQDRGGSRTYYQVDGLGSTRALKDAAGQVVAAYNYDAFGRLILRTGGVANSHLFAGEQRDLLLGLDYLRARHLDTATGRFLE